MWVSFPSQVFCRSILENLTYGLDAGGVEVLGSRV